MRPQIKISLALFFSIAINLLPLMIGFPDNGFAEQKIMPMDSFAGDNFGGSVSITDNHAAISANGAAYIFQRNGMFWIETARLTSGNDYFSDAFGNKVSLTDNYAVVGAVYDDEGGENSGAAYIFKRNGETWDQVIKLKANDAAVKDRFGSSAAITNNYAFVGSPAQDDFGDNSGAVYIYKRDGEQWNQHSKLTVGEESINFHFGFSVAVTDHFLFVGAIGDEENGHLSGAVYIYKRKGDAWVKITKLTEANGHPELTETYSYINNRFGSYLSGTDKYLIVATRDSMDNPPAMVYIFERKGNSWKLSAKLQPDDGSGSNFVYNVSITDKYAIVGAWEIHTQDGSPSVSLGSAYIFKPRRKDWIQVARLTASDGVPDNRFGQSVSAANNHAIVGAISDYYNYLPIGAAYIYDLH